MDGQTIHVESGSATLLYSQREFEIIFPKGEDAGGMWCFSQELSLTEKTKTQLKSLPAQLPPSELLQILLDQGNGLGLSEDENISRLRNSLAIAAFNEYFRLAHLTSEEHAYPRAIHAAKRFIDADFLAVSDLEQIAEKAAVNSRYLIALFKEHLGTTPMRYVWRLRGQRGVHLLQRTGMTVADIAYKCGFNTANHFSHYIKGQYGASPREIRNRHRATISLLEDEQ